MSFPEKWTISVAFDVDFFHSLQIYEGVCEYARGYPHWHVIPLNLGFEKTLTDILKSGNIDGLIGAFVSDAWLSEVDLAQTSVVNIAQLSDFESVPSVGFDFYKVGQEVADYFCRNEVTSFCFLGIAGQYASSQLFAGFSQFLQQRDFTAERMVGATESYWLEWIQSLPKPAALFAANDSLARRFIRMCRRFQIEIPKDVLIVGVGDVSVESIYAEMEISSVPLPGVALGLQAAEVLDQQKQKLSIEQTTYRLQAEPLVQRESSQRGKPMDLALERVLNYIQNNLEKPLVVSELAGLCWSLTSFLRTPLPKTPTN